MYTLLIIAAILWPITISVVAIAVGLVVVPIAAALKAYAFALSPRYPWAVMEFTSPLMSIWNNDEDGIDGHPLWLNGEQVKYHNVVKGHVLFQRIVYWSAIRNPANNLRYYWPLKLIIQPRLVRVVASGSWGFLVRQGLRYSFWLNLPRGLHFWLGWKIKPEDAGRQPCLPMADYRSPGAGFAIQLRR